MNKGERSSAPLSLVQFRKLPVEDFRMSQRRIGPGERPAPRAEAITVVLNWLAGVKK